MRRPLPLATLATSAVLLAAPFTHAQTPWGAPPATPGYDSALALATGTRTRTEGVELGAGMRAERTFLCRLRGYGAEQCSLISWRPQGFSFGTHVELEQAMAFAGDGHGRVVASTDHDVLFTDDRGQRWQHASWNGIHRPQIIVIDPRSRFGVAVAEGAIHVTEDGGGAWRFVRELSSRRITRVAVAGTHAALADDTGAAWAILHGAELSTLREGAAVVPSFGAYDPRVRMELQDDTIVVVDPRGQSFVITEDRIERRP